MPNNEKQYLELSKPFDGADAAHVALKDFEKAVSEARVKFRIADVSMVMMVTVDYGDTAGLVIKQGYLGESRNELAMVAYAFGVVQADNKAFINKLVAGGR